MTLRLGDRARLDVPDELEVSHQALSERLRRGHGNLIDRTLQSKGKPQTEPSPETEH